MKNYLPDYTRVKGLPRDHKVAEQVKLSLGKEEQDIIDAFVKKCQITVGSKDLLRTASNTITLFFDVVEKPFSEVTKEDVEHFVSLVNNSGKSRNGRKHVFFMLKKFLGLYYKDKTVLEIVKSKRETGKGSRIAKSDLITPQELERMLRSANTLRDKALITLLYESAGRPDEILGLRWKDITINDDNFAEISLFSGKKKEMRHIIVNDCVLHLQRWKREYSYPDISQNDYVFVGKTRDKHLTSPGLLKIVKTIGKKAQIDKTIYPYLFRHTRLTFMRQKLKTPHYTQFAGHTERQATTYVHLDTDDLREALLRDIYPTKELTPENRHQLEIQLETQSKEIQLMKKQMDEFKDSFAKNIAEALGIEINGPIDYYSLNEGKVKGIHLPVKETSVLNLEIKKKNSKL